MSATTSIHDLKLLVLSYHPVIASLYRALHVGRSLDSELVLGEICGMIPLSVTRREDIERLRRTAQGRLVGVR